MGKKHSLEQLRTLGEELLTSPKAHVNNLTILMTYISVTSRPEHTLESLLSLQAFFTPLLPQLPSTSKAASSSKHEDPELIYTTWLRSKFDDLVQSLITIAISSQSDETLRKQVLDTIMEFVKVGKGGRFHSAIYHKLLHSIVHSTLVVDDMILDYLVSEYFKYIDVSFFTYTSLEKLAQTSDEQNVEKIYHLLSKIPPLEDGNDKSDHKMWNGLGIFISETGSAKRKKKTVKSGECDENVLLAASDISKKMKLKFTKAWISFLRLPLPVDVYKEVLVSLDQDVIPRLTNPIMLCDFLSRSYDIGGVVSVMALSSLFVLMTKHGLEYPDFYVKLYALLEPSVFMAKHRAKFFELLDSCLKSPLLPAYLAAAYSKKLSRLALYAPPSGSLIIIALIHNLLRRHPSINCLVHKEEDDDSDLGGGIDHFNNEETHPAKANALKSSLWEIDILAHHYCPPVSRFVLSLENDLTVRAKTSEVSVKDFSCASYATIFNDEIRRRVKQVPLAFYKSTPTTLLSESEFSGWTFNQQQDQDDDDDSVSVKRQKILQQESQ